MAMFDLENGGDVKLKACKTSSPTLVKAKTVGNVEAEGCEAGIAPPDPVPAKLGARILKVAVDKALNILVGLVVAALALWLGLR